MEGMTQKTKKAIKKIEYRYKSPSKNVFKAGFDKVRSD